MVRNVVCTTCVALLLAITGTGDAQEKRSGTVIGELKSKKDTPNGKNTKNDSSDFALASSPTPRAAN